MSCNSYVRAQENFTRINKIEVRASVVQLLCLRGAFHTFHTLSLVRM